MVVAQIIAIPNGTRNKMDKNFPVGVSRMQCLDFPKLIQMDPTGTGQGDKSGSYETSFVAISNHDDQSLVGDLGQSGHFGSSSTSQIFEGPDVNPAGGIESDVLIAVEDVCEAVQHHITFMFSIRWKGTKTGRCNLSLWMATWMISPCERSLLMWSSILWKASLNRSRTSFIFLC